MVLLPFLRCNSHPPGSICSRILALLIASTYTCSDSDLPWNLKAVVCAGFIKLLNCPNIAAVVLSPVAPTVPKEPLPSLWP